LVQKQLQHIHEENIKYILDTALICNEVIIDKSISVIMRELDVKKSKQEYAASKFPEYYEWIDIEA